VDGSGEIGIDKVSGLLLVRNINLILRAPVQTSVEICQSRVSHSPFFSLSPPRPQQWREMFESFDKNKDDIIDAAELSIALEHYECVLFHLKVVLLQI
jgi:hypothetical protein